MNVSQLKQYVVKPTLKKLGMYSPEAVQLLLGTAAQESHMGEYIHQLGEGPALGIYQMEPATHDDIVYNYLMPRHGLRLLFLQKFDCSSFDPERLVYDLRYATLFARLHYRRIPKPLPNVNHIHEFAAYWKKYYNTHLGSGTKKEFISNYNKFIVGG